MSNPSAPHTASQPSAPSPAAGSPSHLSAHRLAANRRNALKSTGPRTKAGKYRSALNRQTRRLVPQPLERELRARGEDPREFCRLHRDLVAIFRPGDPAASTAVAMLASAWWQKARRIRQWVGAGAANCADLDERIEDLMVLVIYQMRKRHQHWMERLEEAVGSPIGPPPEVRRRIEDQLKLFGGRRRPGKHGAKAEPEAQIGGPGKTLEACLERELLAIIAKQAARSGSSQANQTHQG